MKRLVVIALLLVAGTAYCGEELTREAARPVVVARWSPSDLARSSARSLISVLQALAGFAIFFVIVVLPVTLLVGIPAWGAARLWERARGRRIGQSPAPTEEMET